MNRASSQYSFDCLRREVYRSSLSLEDVILSCIVVVVGNRGGVGVKELEEEKLNGRVSAALKNGEIGSTRFETILVILRFPRR